MRKNSILNLLEIFGKKKFRIQPRNADYKRKIQDYLISEDGEDQISKFASTKNLKMLLDECLSETIPNHIRTLIAEMSSIGSLHELFR